MLTQSLHRSYRTVFLCWQGLLPYYRMLLPILNLLKDQNLNLGDMIDYSQVRQFSSVDFFPDSLQEVELLDLVWKRLIWLSRLI